MSPSILSACIWVVVATIVALLPMRRQFVPGVALLIVAPVLLVWIGIAHGPWLALAGFAGFVSMFRNPLRYFWRRARGETPELPKELRK